jgi:multidrug efflux system outer membrane protein
MMRSNAPRRSRVAAALALSASMAACTVGPDYKRPQMPAPPQHRFVEAATAESLADAPWWDVARDPQLQELVREAITANLDLRVAIARVEEARAQAGIAKSFLYPQIGASGGYTAQQASRLSEPPQGTANQKTYQNYDVGFRLTWEIDLFGRLRREKEAAFAAFLATEQARRGVYITLVADVASTYFLLRELDLELQIARETLRLNDETVAFYERRLTGGVSNRLELDQALANRARTAAFVPQIEQQIAITENALSLLLGRPPGPITRGAALGEQYMPPQVPVGLPAALLERRPDVAQAEQLLIASNASVGAARALFFPSISLTGLLGSISGELSNLLKADSNVWSVSPGLFQPIFQGGRIRRNYEAAQARFDQAMAQYQKAALNSYREVADSLITIIKQREARLEREKGVAALQDASKLSRERYDTGLANYLEILIADQQLFDQQLSLARTRGDELRALVQLYRALGGGWQPELEASAPAETGAAK